MRLIRRKGWPRNLRGARILRVTLKRRGRKHKAIRQRHARRVAKLKLVGLPRATYTARIRVRLRSGKRVTLKREYMTCGPKRKR